MNEKNNSDKVGPLIGSIIIILIVIMGAFYLFTLIKSKIELQKENDRLAEESSMNNSDNISEMEADINSVEVENFDEEMEAVEVEFKI